MTTREEFEEAARRYVEMELELRRMALDLLGSTGAANLAEVFADEPAMLELLRDHLPGWS